MAIMILATSLWLKAHHYMVANMLLVTTVLFAGIVWIMIIRLILQNPFLDKRAKIFWMVLSLLIPVVGNIIYVVMENRKLGL